MPDRYDIAVAYLTTNPEEIYCEWVIPTVKHYGYLFSFLTPDRAQDSDKLCGCPSMVKSCQGKGSATWNPELTTKIRELNLPSFEYMLACQYAPIEWIVEHIVPRLGLFAQAQRLADGMFPGRYSA